MSKEPIKRGEIYWVKFGKTVGTEIREDHPAVVISNNWQNAKGSRVVVLPMSSKIDKIYPFDLYVGKIISDYKESKIVCEQVKSISKKRLLNKAGGINPRIINKSGNQIKKGAGVWG